MKDMTSPANSQNRLTPTRERQLIRAAKRGCAESAHELVTTHEDRLHSFIWRMVRDNHAAEEVCQDAFLRAFQALDSFDDNYRFSTWLFTIAYRLCLNQMRKQRDVTVDLDFGTLAAPNSAEQAHSVADQVANSEEAARLKKVIWDSVEKLTPSQRATVLLFYRESLSCQEIGEILDIPASTVKSHLHRARGKLKDLLGKQLVDDWSIVCASRAGGAA